ncbi:hypothetical protein [Pantoea ananatis]|uniref:hypothetical protein n=1 Tax=Pantoea ananas TaxID=553 RepID=UPI000496B029|nr:hypothetical protein [Pantoea ananatis]
MANNLFVTYDLIKTKDYPAVHNAIKTLGNWAKLTESNWYVSSNYNSQQAANIIRAAMDNDDKVIVVDATNNNSYSYNIVTEATKQMQDNWYK